MPRQPQIVLMQHDDMVGARIAQAKVRILPRDNAESLEERVLAEEHKLYPQALAAYADALRTGRLALPAPPGA